MAYPLETYVRIANIAELDCPKCNGTGEIKMDARQAAEKITQYVNNKIHDFTVNVQRVVEDANRDAVFSATAELRANYDHRGIVIEAADAEMDKLRAKIEKLQSSRVEQYSTSLQQLVEERNELVAAGEELLALIDDVPVDVNLGSETDRVFALYEFDRLRNALQFARKRYEDK